MTKRYLIPVILLIVFALAACGSQKAAEPTPTAATPTPVAEPTPSPTPEPTPTPDPAAELLAGMTVEQKVGQLLVAGISGLEPGEDGAQAVADYQVGGIILFGRNVESAEQLTALTNGLKGLNGDYIPLFLSVDQEGGRVDRMPPEVADLPAAYQFGQIADPDQRMNACFALGQALAAQCAAFGLNLDFAPVMDIWSNPDNTVIGDRAFGSDLASVTSAANETAYGILSGGVIAAAKHFPGHGDTAEDSHTDLAVTYKTREELENCELLPFAADTGLHAVMVGHIAAPNVIGSDTPATLSAELIAMIPDAENTLIVTDSLSMDAITKAYTPGEAAIQAIQAGCDVLLMPNSLPEAYDAVLAAVQNGTISEARLDQSVNKVLHYKQQFAV